MSRWGHNTRRRYRESASRPAGAGSGGLQWDPVASVRRAYAAAVAPPDPSTAPSKPKTWADMTEEEKAAMRRLYERKP